LRRSFVKNPEADHELLTRRRFFSAASCLVGSSAIRGGAGQADQGTLARSSVTIAVADYVRYMPFSTGEIRATDMALTVLRGDRSEMLRRATSTRAEDRR
jgi:hypothetical protein